MDNVRLVRNLYDAFGRGDIPTVLGAMSPDSGTFKATGKSMDAQVCHVWDVKDGKLTRFQQYVDTAKLRDVTRAG
jgi:ketosteroid isomerase-like protein